MTSRRDAPGVRVALLPDERAGSGEPIDLRGKVISFAFEDSDAKASRATLELDNFDLQFFDRSDLALGAVLEVAWGYPGDMAPPRRVVLRKLRGFQTLTLEGHATVVLMNRVVRTRSWTDRTRAEVVREIAAEHGYGGAFARIADAGPTRETMTQIAETDARFLRRLAAREHFEFVVDEAGLFWGPRDALRAPERTLDWFSGDVLSVHVDSDLTRRVGRIEVRGRDPMQKTTVVARATASTASRGTLGEIVEVVDPETGGSTLETRNATSSVRASAVTSESEAVREADARFRSAEAEAMKLTVQVVGDPHLRARAIVELRGVPSYLAGKYYVRETKHVLSGAGYTTELKLVRDAAGRRSTQASQATAQGGERNRADRRAPGTLAVVEVIDPETGEAVTEFRRQGERIGRSGPEAQ
jgi:phage protein D